MKDEQAERPASLATPAPEQPTLSDQQIQEWADRHDLGISSITDLRCILEDARTLHLASPKDAPNQGTPHD